MRRVDDVETKSLVRAVKRNIDHFPEDCTFQLTQQEFGDLRPQFVTSSPGYCASWYSSCQAI